MTLKGIHIVEKKLAGGGVRSYVYAWRGGPRMESDPDDAEAFLVEWLRLTRARGAPSSVETVADLIKKYVASSGFSGLKPVTRGGYQDAIDRIEAEFHDLELRALEERGARALIREWRDREFADRRRTGDLTMAVFNVVLNYGVDQEFITRNPLEKMGRLHEATRRDLIWSDEQLALVAQHAPRQIAQAVKLAIWTGQRQADLIRLTWSAYDGAYIRLQQAKSGRGKAGRRVKILVSGELRALLSEIRAEQEERASHPEAGRRVPKPVTILTTEHGRPWRTGFKASWGKAKDMLAAVELEKLGPAADGETRIADLHFHDLRGTFITLAHRAGASIKDIAEASGHDEKECERVIRQHYLAAGADNVIAALESRAAKNATRTDL